MKGMVSVLYGAEASVQIEASLPMGDSVCVTAVQA